MTDDTHPGAGERSGRRERRGDRDRSSQSTDPRIGQVFGDRYRVTERIGIGGMGVVYRARHLRLERPVVVKVLTDERIDDETSLARFEREAKTLSKLDHNNVVTVYDFGQEGDLTYLVMEYVDGIELDDLVHHEGHLGIDLFAPIATQILDGVGHAHQKGLVHRDLKPNNVMLTEREDNPYFVKVLDFGLAKLVSGASDVTAKDSIVGSMPYLSPEQIKGDDIDQRVDVYSLGIVFYYALSGEKPFTGSRASILYDQVHADPPPLEFKLPDDHRIPAAVIDLIGDCLAKDPEARPHDARAMLDRLHGALGQRHAPSHGSDTTTPSSAEIVGTPSTQDHREAPRRDTPADSRSNRRSAPAEASGSAPERSDDGAGDRNWVQFGAAAAIAAALLAGAAMYLLPGDGSGDASSTARAVAEVEKVIAEDDFEKANDRISALRRSGEASTETVSRLERRLVAARRYDEAQSFERQGKTEKAISAYEDVLDLVDDFRESKSRLARLEKKHRERAEQKPDKSLLDVDTDRKAEVLVDGESLGEAPLEQKLEPGSHDLLLKSADGVTLEKTIELEAGEPLTLEANLEEVDSPKDRGGAAPSDDPSESTGAATTSGEEEGARQPPSPEPSGTSDSPARPPPGDRGSEADDEPDRPSEPEETQQARETGETREPSKSRESPEESTEDGAQDESGTEQQPESSDDETVVESDESSSDDSTGTLIQSDDSADSDDEDGSPLLEVE